MAVIKPPQQAIKEFVEAIAQHYLAVQRQSEHQDPESIAEEFVSAIETDLKSTLRHRLSQLETKKDAIETPTVDLSPSALGVNQSKESLDYDGLQPTIDTGAGQNHSSASAIDTPTMDSGAEPNQASASAVDTPTMDTSAGSSGDAPTMDSEPAAQAAVRSGSQRAGSSTPSMELSFDTEAQQRAARRGPAAPPNYEIISTLGKGGMGVVYKARHIPLNRLVAVKMIISGANASPEQLSRFQREAEAAAHLKHPNIVAVYEVGQHLGLPYFSLEYVEGKSVSDLMGERTLSPREAAELLIPVARAVQYSHDMGVLHRDLKPQNILLDQDGTPKVADFGLAKRLDVDEKDDEKTREGVILGTPGYMAPEQARHTERVGPHTDVYALGSILYYLMTGRPPFKAPTPFETVRQMLHQEPLSPSRLQSGMDKDLETICMKALEKDIDKRYATAGQFADELERFVHGEPIVARPITRSERVMKWCRRNPKVATLTATAATLLMCLLFGGIISALVINEQKKAERIARGAAEENEELAKEQGRLAADTTRLLLYNTRDFFDKNPELRELRKPLMDMVLEGAERIYTDNEQYDVNEVFTTSADFQLGQIYLNAGELDDARKQLLKAESQLKKLRAKNENLTNADVSQMNITMALADTFRGLGELETAKDYYLDLEQQREAYFEKYPQFGELKADLSLAEVYGKLAMVYRLLGQPEPSLQYAQRAVEIRRRGVETYSNSRKTLAELAGALSTLSNAYESAGDTEQMLATSSEALKIQMQLAEFTQDTAQRHNTAKDQKLVARQYLMLGRDEEALELLNPAAAALDALVTKSDDRRIQNQAIDVHFWKGFALQRLRRDAKASYERAEALQRQMIERSDNINSQGILLKILARAGKVDEAIQLADEIAKSSDKMMNCGYAACGYGMITEHMEPEDPRRDAMINKAIELTRQLIRHGYHDFESMRKTDLDFEPLQDEPEFIAMLDQEESRLANAQAASE